MKPDYEESIENEDNIASDELLYMEEMEQARIIEQAALAEIELEMAAYPEPDADVPEEEATEAASRTMLKRELRAQALLRLEDGARTEEDFKEVIKQWDHLDDNRERKERYHEIGREMNRLTEDAPKNPVVIPYPIHHNTNIKTVLLQLSIKYSYINSDNASLPSLIIRHSFSFISTI